MRIFICHLLMFSVLFLSAEGAWDMAKELHAHRDNLAHQVNVDDQEQAQPDPLSDGEGSHSDHLCDGHTFSITASFAGLVIAESNKYNVFNTSPRSEISQAPPTPPPNA